MEKAKIREFIQNEIIVKKNLVDFMNEDNLIEKGVIDSLSILKVVSFIEKEFAVAIEDIDLLPENFETIDMICAFVQKKRSAL